MLGDRNGTTLFEPIVIRQFLVELSECRECNLSSRGVVEMGRCCASIVLVTVATAVVTIAIVASKLSPYDLSQPSGVYL